MNTLARCLLGFGILLAAGCDNDDNGVVSNDTGPPDTTPPVVVSTIPESGASDVDITTDVSVTFSEPIDPASIDTLTFRAGIEGTSGTFSFDGSTVTFNPTYFFNSYVQISVTLTAGIRDSAGNQLASDYSWLFDTGPEAP